MGPLYTNDHMSSHEDGSGAKKRDFANETIPPGNGILAFHALTIV